MKSAVFSVIGTFWAFACGGADVLTDIQNSHISANVPQDAQYKSLLDRDLHSYFCGGTSAPNCTVQFNFLRKAATQSGVAYPKYYLWVIVRKERTSPLEGAVRVAAMDRVKFVVTDFMSVSGIRSAPKKVSRVFPALLVPAIMHRARK